MMKLTREEAIANHRKMWNWIADETERLERVVLKPEYFKEHSISHNDFPVRFCYCCSFDLTYYSLPLCGACPINWGVDTEMNACCNKKSPYEKWDIIVKYYPNDWKSAAKLAREIANLPERGDNHQ